MSKKDYELEYRGLFWDEVSVELLFCIYYAYLREGCLKRRCEDFDFCLKFAEFGKVIVAWDLGCGTWPDCGLLGF